MSLSTMSSARALILPSSFPSPRHHAQPQWCARSREVAVQHPYPLPDPFDIGRCRPEILQAQNHPKWAAVRCTGTRRASVAMIPYVAPDRGGGARPHGDRARIGAIDSFLRNVLVLLELRHISS